MSALHILWVLDNEQNVQALLDLNHHVRDPNLLTPGTHVSFLSPLSLLSLNKAGDRVRARRFCSGRGWERKEPKSQSMQPL